MSDMDYKYLFVWCTTYIVWNNQSFIFCTIVVKLLTQHTRATTHTQLWQLDQFVNFSFFNSIQESH